MEKLREMWGKLRADGGLWLLIALAVGICLLLPRESAQDAAQASGEEARLAAVLSRMAGAGEVEVVVRWAETADPLGQTGQRTPLGAVVVAQGAEDIGVRLQLIRAVTALLDLDSGAVEVFAMEQEGMK